MMNLYGHEREVMLANFFPTLQFDMDPGMFTQSVCDVDVLNK
jgi:hypothetical protein